MKTSRLTAPALGFVVLGLVGCVAPGGGPAGQGANQETGGGRGCTTSAESAPNCFVIVLEPPPAGSAQPRRVRGVVGRGGRPPDVEQSEMPAAAGVPETILIAPDISENHPETHEHEDGGASGSGHCHYWVRIRTTWYQLHC